MLGGIVKGNPPIKMLLRFRDHSGAQRRNTSDAMCYQERTRRSLFLGERQELRRKIATYIAVERHVVRGPEAIRAENSSSGLSA
jgi:hypothetical protein